MENLEEYLINHPNELSEWLEKFPWENFEGEVTISEENDVDVVVARRLVVEEDAEISKLAICYDAVIGKGAEIHGTVLCYRALIGADAECNYVICRSAEIDPDAEVRAMVVVDSLKIAEGAEINELVLLEYTFLDIHQDSVIKQKDARSVESLNNDIEQLLNLTLQSAIDHFNSESG